MNKDLGPVSAYAVAVANGFVGSVKEWLASLKGEKGKDGERGPAGADGKTPQLKIGTVTRGSTASASITGTAEEPQLNLVLPEGTGGSAGVGQSTEGGGEIFNDYKNNAATKKTAMQKAFIQRPVEREAMRRDTGARQAERRPMRKETCARPSATIATQKETTQKHAEWRAMRKGGARLQACRTSMWRAYLMSPESTFTSLALASHRNTPPILKRWIMPVTCELPGT